MLTEGSRDPREKVLPTIVVALGRLTVSDLEEIGCVSRAKGDITI